MNSSDSRFRRLRQQAEQKLSKITKSIDEFSVEELKELVHDYQVYQVELELQNEELRDTQKQLEESKQSYARLYNDAPVGYLVLDRNGVIENANETFAVLVGQEHLKLYGMALSNFIATDDRISFNGQFRAFFAEPDGRELNFRIQGAQGDMEVRCVGRLAGKSSAQSESGASLRLLLVVRDISAQVQAQMQFRSLFQDTPVSIVIQDPGSGEIIDANPMAWQQYGLSSISELKTHKFWLEPPYSLSDAQAWIRKANREGTQRFEWLSRKKNGDLLWQEVQLTTIRYRGQGAILATGIDITERKEIALELNRHSDELTRSNSELEQFAYVVSHDLRQPLRMINSYMNLLERALDDKLDDETRGFIGFAACGVQRMDQMLVSLLEYSRVGRKGEPMEPLVGRQSVDEALSFLAPEIEAIGATVRLSGDWPQIVVSRNEFTRLWQNLIGNALKYRAADRVPEVEVTVAPEDGGWRFCVADNGIGIDPQQFDRLFKVFQRLHSRDQYEGTGIGLAVARKIVERHGGRIWVESEGEGQGCRFIFTLPMVRGDFCAYKPNQPFFVG